MRTTPGSSSLEQATLDDLHTCPGCSGAGCLACDHTGLVTYDPDDRSIPFGTFEALRKDTP